jgi:hypothetical protein
MGGVAQELGDVLEEQKPDGRPRRVDLVFPEDVEYARHDLSHALEIPPIVRDGAVIPDTPVELEIERDE